MGVASAQSWWEGVQAPRVTSKPSRGIHVPARALPLIRTPLGLTAKLRAWQKQEVRGVCSWPSEIHRCTPRLNPRCE